MVPQIPSCSAVSISGTIANGPITNVYFNSCVYSRETERVNRPALLKILAKQGKETVEETKKDPSAIMKALMSVPLPFHAALSGSFGGVENNFPDPGDTGRWEAFSPTALSEWMCNPVMINHFTSDILVPVDQICKRFTYDKPGSSLPGDFNARMPEDLPGKLNCSFEERISEEKKEVLRIPVDEPEKDSILPFTLEKQFQINIFDEGQIENYGTHRKALNAGRADDIPYLEALFEQTSENNVLTPEKLRELLTRFLGKSVQLPAHTGVDSSIYGSLEVYQKEVCEELADWVRFHGTKALEELFEKICQDVGTDKAVERELRLAMTEIRKVL